MREASFCTYIRCVVVVAGGGIITKGTVASKVWALKSVGASVKVAPDWAGFDGAVTSVIKVPGLRS